MGGVVNKLNDKTKMIILFALVVLVVGFSWQGAVDDAARSYLNKSIKDAAIIYGATRSINALVSVLQSIDISIVVASIQLGDILTPIHDTLERFAEVMTFAIVSLTLQRVLIEIVEHSFFNVLLTLSGVGLCLAVFIKMYVPQAVRLFVTLLFVRFSLALVLMLNMTVDHVFLEHQVQQEYDKMSEMKQELDSTSQLVINESYQPEEVQVNQEKHPQTIDKPKPVEKVEANALEGTVLVADLYTEQTTEEGSFFGAVSGFVSSAVDTVTGTASDITESTVEVVGGVVEKGKSLISTKTVILNKLKELKESATTWVENFLTLMALFLLKTIFLPLLFWYILLKYMKLIWVKEWVQPNVETTVKA